MKQLVLTTTCIIILGSCTLSADRPSKVSENVSADTSKISADISKEALPQSVSGASQQEEEIYPSWMDSVMLHYVRHSSNELIQYALRDSPLHEEWLPDQQVQTDSAVYWIFQVGHDFEDEGLRFVTDGWIYIDTASRRLYEFDIGRERLVLWRGDK